MTRIAVTGAAGFVGRHVLPRLLEDGHEVRALLRPGSTRGTGDVEWVTGDIRSAERVSSFVKGCDVVLHLAASFSTQDDMTDIIVAGTRNVVNGAKEAGVGRLVFLSCLAAQAAASVPYYAAKWQAEQLVRGADLPYVILRPSLVVGPGDAVTGSLAAIIQTLPVIPLPRLGGNRQQPVDVEDLARCIQLSVGGEAFQNEEISVGGPMFLSLRELVDLIQGQLGVLKPKLLVPPALLPSVCRLLPAAARDLYVGPRLAGFRETNYTSPGIVERIFGFQPRSITPRLPEYLA